MYSSTLTAACIQNNFMSIRGLLWTEQWIKRWTIFVTISFLSSSSGTQPPKWPEIYAMQLGQKLCTIKYVGITLDGLLQEALTSTTHQPLAVHPKELLSLVETDICQTALSTKHSEIQPYHNPSPTSLAWKVSKLESWALHILTKQNLDARFETCANSCPSSIT